MSRSRSDQEAICFAITGAFEGRGYTERCGDFDGEGWSVGFLQWNLGQRTAQRLFLAMYEMSPKTFERLLRVEYAGKHYDLSGHLLEVCKMPTYDAVQWAKDRSYGAGLTRVVEPWSTALGQLFAEPGFQAIQRHLAQDYVRAARESCAHFHLNTQRALALFFDIAVQNGQGKLLHSKHPEVLAIFEQLGGMNLPYLARMQAIVQAVVETSRKDLDIQEDVHERKMAIVRGRGRVHGHMFNLAGTFGLDDEELIA